MTNDEKILEMLGQMQSQMGQLSKDMVSMKDDIASLKTDVADLKADMVGVKADVADLKADMVGVKADVADLKADMVGVKTDVAGLKTDMADVKRRLTRVETRQALADKILQKLVNDVSQMKENDKQLRHQVSRIEINLENKTLPAIELLAEGQITLRRKLINKNRMFIAEEDIQTLKNVVRIHSQEIADLKKAR